MGNLQLIPVSAGIKIPSANILQFHMCLNSYYEIV